MSEPNATPSEPSLISQALSMPGEEKALLKSARIRQLDELTMATDRMAGLAENRRSVAEYNRQTDRAVKAIVDAKIRGDNAAMPEDENITNTLGDTFNEVHNHYPPAEKKGVSPLAAAALGSLAGVGGAGGLAAAILAGSSLIGQPEPDPPTPMPPAMVQPAEAAASVTLYYRRSDGTLVPLDGAETSEGASIDVTP